MGFGPYTASMNATSVTAAKILVQLWVPDNSFVQITRVWIENTDVETSNQVQGELVRLTAAASVTSFTPIKRASTGQAASACVGGASATGTNATSAGTVTDTFYPRGFNILQGWEWIAANEMDRISCIGANGIGLRLASAPAGATVLSAGIDYIEWC